MRAVWLSLAFLGIGWRAKAQETTSSGSTAQTPQLIFSNVDTQLTTCQENLIEWFYFGPDGRLMTLSVTNIDVEQNPSTTTTRLPTQTNGPITNSQGQVDIGARATPSYLIEDPGSIDGDDTLRFTMNLSTSLSPNGREYLWVDVDVPEGWYKYTASISENSFESRFFHVTNGSDISCLIAPPAPSTSSSSTTPTDTSSSTAPPTSSETNGNSGNGTVPAEPNSSGANVNKGAIAGGVVGGIALVAAIFAAFFVFRCSKRNQRRQQQRGDHFSSIGKWGNLGSFDSATRRATAASPAVRKHSAVDSLGPIMLPAATSPAPGDAPYSPGDEEKYGSPSTSSEHGRSPFSDTGHHVVDAQQQQVSGPDEVGMIPIVYDPPPSAKTRNSTASSTYSYTQNNNFSRPRSRQIALGPVSVTPSSSYSATQTFPESVHNSTATFEDYHPHPAAARFAESPTFVSPPLSSPSNDYPPTASSSSPTDYPPTSPPATEGKRRTPRKPVPSYAADSPELTHKSSSHSLNSKPVHYLIPDMPPSTRD